MVQFTQGGDTFPTEARERPCGLLEEVQRGRSVVYRDANMNPETQETTKEISDCWGRRGFSFLQPTSRGQYWCVLASFCTQVSSI